jgi:hypothetical protein
MEHLMQSTAALELVEVSANELITSGRTLAPEKVDSHMDCQNVLLGPTIISFIQIFERKENSHGHIKHIRVSAEESASNRVIPATALF